MQPPDSDHDGRALDEFTVTVDQTRAAVANTAAALNRLEQTWDRGLREALRRLDEVHQGVEEARQLAQRLVDREFRLTACARPSLGSDTSTA